jgi:hypothetical protein
LDHKVFKDKQDLEARLDLRVIEANLVPLVLLGRKVLKGLEEQLERQVRRVLKVSKVSADPMALKASKATEDFKA